MVRPPSHLTSTSSDRVKAVRALHDRAGRRKAGAFLVEGPQGVSAALDSGVVIHELFVGDDTLSSFPDLLAQAHGRGIPVTTAAPHVLTALGETDHPQGVLAVCGLLDSSRLPAILASPGPVVVLDRVADPGNVGTIVRTAEAAGAAGVVLTPESADIHGGKVVRATTGSLFRVPVVPEVPMGELIAAAKGAGRQVAVTAGSASQDLFDAVSRGELAADGCIVIGSEAHGVGEQALEEADITIRIPMTADVESLNAGVCAAIVLYVLAYGSRSGIPRGRGSG